MLAQSTMFFKRRQNKTKPKNTRQAYEILERFSAEAVPTKVLSHVLQQNTLPGGGFTVTYGSHFAPSLPLKEFQAPYILDCLCIGRLKRDIENCPGPSNRLLLVTLIQITIPVHISLLQLSLNIISTCFPCTFLFSFLPFPISKL